jgi:hypothetical protein
LRCAGTRPGNVLALVVLSVSDVLTVSVPSRWFGVWLTVLSRSQ